MFAVFIPSQSIITCGPGFDTREEAQQEADAWSQSTRIETIVVEYSPELVALRAEWDACGYRDWYCCPCRVEEDGLHFNSPDAADTYKYD